MAPKVEPDKVVKILKKERKLKIFDGSEGAKGFRIWKEEALAAIESLGYEGQEAGKHLYDYLGADCKREIKLAQGESVKDSADSLLKALGSIYGDKRTLPQRLSAFYNCKQQQLESILDYSHRLLAEIEAVTELDDAVKDDVRTKMLVSAFAENVRDRHLRWELSKKKDDATIKTFKDLRPNLFIDVKKESDYKKALMWVVKLLRDPESHCRILIFAENEHLLSQIFFWVGAQLRRRDGEEAALYSGKRTTADGRFDIRDRRIAIIKSSTADLRKREIQADLSSAEPTLKVVLATSTLGMGVHIPGVTHVICWGLPDNPQLLWQEFGRCARDTTDGIGVLYWTLANLRREKKFPEKINIDPTMHALATKSDKFCPRIRIMDYYSCTEDEQEELDGLRRSLRDKKTSPCRLHLCCNYHHGMCRCTHKWEVYDKFRVPRAEAAEPADGSESSSVDDQDEEMRDEEEEEEEFADVRDPDVGLF